HPLSLPAALPISSIRVSVTDMAVPSATLADDLVLPRRFSLSVAIRRNPTIAFGGVLLLALIVMAIAAPVIAGDPFKIAPVNRLRPPSERRWFGTDQFGRAVS